MTAPAVFVIPFEEKLLKGLSGQRLIIRTSRTEDIPVIGEVAAHLQCALEAVILETPSSLTSLPFADEWKAVPLLVHAPELGRVSHLLQHLPVIRGMSLRLMLPTEGEDNYTSLRVLSSLGIPSGFRLKGESADWEQLLDLATYYFFNVMGHGPIAPFDTLGERYAPGEGAPFGSTCFDEPGITYLFLNADGEVALSMEALEKEDFLCHSPNELSEARIVEELEEQVDRWKRVFMSAGPCPRCPVLKLCRGRIAGDDGTVPEGCIGFFSELMGMVEEYQAMRNGRGG